MDYLRNSAAAVVSGAGYSAPADAIKTTPVDAGFANAFESAHRLQAKIAQLAERLEPVLSPLPPPAAQTPVDAAKSLGHAPRGSVCARLEGLSDTNFQSYQMLQALVERLEV